MGQSDERRKHERLSAELFVHFRHLGRPRESYAEISRNLSEGGIFVETSIALSLGTTLNIEIEVGHGEPPVKLLAEVARVEEELPKKGSRSTSRTRGMALAFIDPDKNEINRLMAVVKRTVEGTHGSDRRLRR